MPTQPLPLTGQETGIDVGVGLQVFLITAEGKIVENPRHYRTAERELKKAPKRVSQRKQGTGEEPAQESGAGARQEASAGPPAAHGLSPQDHPKTALALVRQYDTISHEAIPPAHLSRRPAPKQDENGT